MTDEVTPAAPDNDWGLPKPEWAKRRRVLWFALVSIVAWISYILYRGTDNALNLQSIMILVPSMIALVSSYVFGAAWDDKNYMSSMIALRNGKE